MGEGALPLAVVLLQNRAAAALKLGRTFRALADASAAAALDPTSAKAAFRLAQVGLEKSGARDGWASSCVRFVLLHLGIVDCSTTHPHLLASEAPRLPPLWASSFESYRSLYKLLHRS